MRGVMRPEVNDVAPYLKRTGAKLTYPPDGVPPPR